MSPSTATGAAAFISLFANLRDPRVERTRKHPLANVVVIAVLGVLAGCEGWDDVHDWGILKQEWLSTFLDLREGIPSADVVRRVFEAIRPKEFQACFAKLIAAWVATMTEPRVVAIDGKTLRRSFDTATGRTPLHLVHAWMANHHILLGQLATDAKSNEITAIPALLEMLDLRGSVVTMDAMGTQKAIIAKVVEKNADYVVAPKDNHPTLRAEVEKALEPLMQASRAPKRQRSYERSEAHGRTETRTVFSLAAPAQLFERDEWAKLTSLVGIRSTRYVDGKLSIENRYYLASPPPDAHVLAGVIRSHWSVENQLHWCLDVQLREDSSRIRSRNGADNFAWLRRFALMKIKRYPLRKRGVAATQRLANAANELLLNLLLTELPNAEQ